MLDDDGLSPKEALPRFMEAVGARCLYSDEVDYDRHWLGLLIAAAGVSFDLSKIDDYKKLIERIGVTLEFDEPPRHRAEADARRLATALAAAAE